MLVLLCLYHFLKSAGIVNLCIGVGDSYPFFDNTFNTFSPSPNSLNSFNFSNLFHYSLPFYSFLLIISHNREITYYIFAQNKKEERNTSFSLV